VSEYTPSTEQVREAAYEHGSTGVTYEEFDRWIAAHDAKVRAEALREAARGMRPGIRGGTCNKACHEADKITLEVRADRIERKASS